MGADLDFPEKIATSPRRAAPPRPATPDRLLPKGYQLRYVAPFCYSPRGLSEVAERSRRLRDLVKHSDPAIIKLCMQRVRQLIDAEPAIAELTSNALLVPVPRSVPQPRDHPPTPPEAIAEALLEIGIGAGIWSALRRYRALAKSAWARRGSRPELPEHCDSLGLLDARPRTTRVLLVDDFISRGRTLLSAAAVLHRYTPGLDIRAFALVRTEGLRQDIDAICAPTRGVIRYSGGDAYRWP